MSEPNDIEGQQLRSLRSAVTAALGELDLMFQVGNPKAPGADKEWTLSFEQPTGLATIGMFVRPEFLFAYLYPLEANASLPDPLKMLQLNLGLPLVKISVDVTQQIIVWGQIPSSCITTPNVRNLLTYVLRGGDEVRAASARPAAT